MIEGRLPSTVRGRRSLAALIAAAMTLALLPGLAAAEDRLNMTVLEGADNVAAAIAWSQLAFPEGETASNAILGRDDLPPDNLASGMLQGVLEGPLLLNPTNTLHAAVKAELERLEVRVVHILGGTSAISATVENALKAEGYAVRRYSGTSRLETAQDVARQHAGAATTAFLARAFPGASDPTSAWADALAGGAWAADEGFPVLFTQTETLSSSTRTYLQTSRIRTVIILGGTGAVSPAVESQLQAMGITVRRVSGATRFATATEIAKERGFDNAGEATSIVLADGQNANGWAAGFAAAGYAADKPIVLSNGSSLPTETDTWLTGGSSSDELIVAPYVADAAATAAADKLGLGKKATVTLDDTSIGQGEDITGKVTPMDDVKSVAVEGEDCITDGTITPNATTGAFTLPLSDSFEPGTCDITITVTYDNDEKQVEEFTVTVTAPPATPAVLDGPELTNVTVHNQTADYTVLKYTFDEAVTLAQDAVQPEDFQVIGFNALARPADIEGFDEDPVQEDPDDPKAILASFFKPDYNEATTATVASGSVLDREGNANPEGSRPLKSVTFPKGQTVRPDLVSVPKIETVDSDTTNEVTAYVVRVTYRFDTAVDLIDATSHNDFYLIDTNGARRNGRAIHTGAGTTDIVVDFGPSDADDTTFAAVKGDADNYRTSVRRAQVGDGGTEDDAGDQAVEDAWDQANIAQTVPVGSTAPAIPYIQSVTLLPDTDQVRYNFSVAMTEPTQASGFFVYDNSANKTTGTAGDNASIVAGTSNKSIVVTFPDGAIDEQVSAAGTDTAAATSAATPPVPVAFQTIGAVDRPYAAGSTIGPELQRVIRTPNNTQNPFGGSEITSYTVTYRFDRDVQDINEVAMPDEPLGFKMYSADGAETEFTTGHEACKRGDTPATKKDVVCTVTDDDEALFEAVKDAVLFAVEEGAVTADDANSTYENYATAKTPS